jgi:hypothetical protein
MKIESVKPTITIPQKAFFSLKEACAIKGINYKTACNRTILQPNKGKPDGHIGGKKAFSYSTIVNWLSLTDEAILSTTEVSND